MPIPHRFRSCSALAAILVALALRGEAQPPAGGSDACGGSSAPAVASAAVIAPLWAWVLLQTELPDGLTPPVVRAVSERCLLALRQSDGQGTAVLGIEAAYAPADATIFLRRRWQEDSAAARSILVHELVHHAQAIGGMRFACPAAAEKQAYAVQEAWLAQWGLDLERAIGLDRMTRLVLTECGM
jgi:hypothetical protein